MLPKINHMLYIQIASFDEEEAKQEFKSRIADANSDYIAMEVPIDIKTGKLKRLHQGDELSIYYLTEGGFKNFFNTKVIGFKDDVTRLVLVEMPEPEYISKVQRRNFLRVPAALEIAIKTSEQIHFLAFTEDVGGGGTSFVCDGSISLKLKSKSECWVLVPYRNGAIEHVHFIGEIVRLKPLETGRQLVMLSYEEIVDAERQKIIRYCFERQLEIRKN